MTDTKRLNLIEHYQWKINFTCDKWNVFNANIDVAANTLREAIDAALAAQAKWAMS